MSLQVRHSKRSRPSPVERGVGFFILGVLTATAIVILWTQARYDLARWRMQPATGTEPAPETSPSPEVPPSPMDTVPDLAPLGPQETYTSYTLADKIDGKAELYLPAGFVGLRTRRFGSSVQPDVWMERYVYDMGQYRNALAVFTAQRRPNSEALTLTPDAYRSANGLFLVHGRFYVEIIASAASEMARQAALDLARAFVDHQAVARREPDVTRLFPVAGQVPDSLSLAADAAFGIDGFDWVHTVHYQRNGFQASAFISRRTTADEAGAMARRFGDYFLEYGGDPVSPPGLPQAPS